MTGNFPRQLVISAIDIGSNSIHGMIASVDAKGGLNELYRDKESVRLGSGMKEGLLRQESIDAAVDFLQKFKAESGKYNAIISAVATSAVREANNKDVFLNSVKINTGIHVNIITGLEEAGLIYKGVSSALPIFERKTLIIDIGGGSTELILAEKGKIKFLVSMKLGAIRTSYEYFENYVTHPEKIEDCKSHIHDIMAESISQIKGIGFDFVVGTSGTIQALGRIALSNIGKASPKFLNGISINSVDLISVFQDIEKLKSPEKRAKIKGLERSRADIITAGELILQNFLKELKIPKIIVSSYALREGIIFDTYEKNSIIK
jgi:exopolyphosphatase / guanosine-5'-triphosphate,3'-diphosphate pyrophosphatase